MKTDLLPVVHAAKLKDNNPGKTWLVEHLWAEQAVGIIGGEPKCCKSFLALSLAVAVAAGVPCLGKFHTAKRAKVLIYPAEDCASIVRNRLLGIAHAHGLQLDSIPLFVATCAQLRLDIKSDRLKLRNTVDKLRPKLIILDPFVRLHNIDENDSGQVAAILAHLRNLQRSFGSAVALVHHAKKGAANARAGQSLRGSSEFHAWGDSNIYLRRSADNNISLTTEHRAHPPTETLTLSLQSDQFPHLKIVDSEQLNSSSHQKLQRHSGYSTAAQRRDYTKI